MLDESNRPQLERNTKFDFHGRPDPDDCHNGMFQPCSDEHHLLQLIVSICKDRKQQRLLAQAIEIAELSTARDNCVPLAESGSSGLIRRSKTCEICDESTLITLERKFVFAVLQLGEEEFRRAVVKSRTTTLKGKPLAGLRNSSSMQYFWTP